MRGFGKLNRVEYFRDREHSGYRKSTSQTEVFGLQTSPLGSQESNSGPSAPAKVLAACRVLTLQKAAGKLGSPLITRLVNLFQACGF